MGQGAEFEESWPKVLEANLRKRFGRRITVFNAGVWGSDPVACYQLLLRKLLRYHPDLVLMGINDSDLNELVVRGGRDRFGSNGEFLPRPRPWLSGWMDRSHLVRRVAISGFGYSWLGAKSGFRTELFAFPAPGKLKTGDPHLNEIVSKVQAAGLPALDVRTGMQADVQESEAGTLYWKHDPHPTARGYAHLAREIEKELVRRRLIPSQ